MSLGPDGRVAATEVRRVDPRDTEWEKDLRPTACTSSPILGRDTMAGDQIQVPHWVVPRSSAAFVRSLRAAWTRLASRLNSSSSLAFSAATIRGARPAIRVSSRR